MTGISGWHGVDPASIQVDITASEMSANLPGHSKPQSLIGDRGALACRLNVELEIIIMDMIFTWPGR